MSANYVEEVLQKFLQKLEDDNGHIVVEEPDEDPQVPLSPIPSEGEAEHEVPVERAEAEVPSDS